MSKQFIHLVSIVCLVGLIAGPGHAQVEPDTILGAWLLDEGTGDVTADGSGNGNDGTLMSAPDWVSGQFGNALDFSGSSSYVDCGNDASLNVDVFSVSFWCNFPSAQGWNHMISRGSHVASGTPGSVNWGVMMFDAQETFLYETFNDTGWVGISVPTTAGEWHHVVATLDETAMQLYHDGALAGSASGGTLLDEARPFVIGARADNGSFGGFFDGSLDEVGYFNAILTAEDIDTIMNSGLAEVLGGSEVAVNPEPAHGDIDVPRDVVLNWIPGMFANTHNVYVGTAFADVDAATVANPLGVLASEGQSDNSLEPAGVYELGQTYYWRVDEVNGAPDNTVFKGAVWSFTVEPVSYPITNITATASSSNSPAMGPEKTIDGSGLNALDQHGNLATDMWLSAAGVAPWIQYEFDQAYKLHEMWVWNSNQLVESFIGFGAKDVIIETSMDGVEWIALEDATQFAQATSTADYTANTIVDFNGTVAQYVRITVNTGWGTIPQYGLSELRFFFIPTYPREPQPLDGTITDSAQVALGWRAGREAVSHQVYLGTDAQDLPLAGTTPESGYDAGALDLAATYYWSVTEVNEAEAVSSYAGDIWSFSTPQYIVVDDFDQYDDKCNRIFFAWEDGLGHNGGEEVDDCDEPASNGNGGGSIVGNDQAPFAEKTIVNIGSRQSLPFNYDNAFGQSEALLRLAGQDWSASGIQTLSLAFRGTAGNTGALYVKINNSKIVYDGDAADIGASTWQPWNIDLSTVSGLQNVTSLSIGVDGGNAAGMLYIDDIRLYPLAGEMLTPADPGNANLVALYSFDGNANDSSGSGYNGVENGTVSYVAGKVGQALNLDGFSAYVTVDSVGIGSAASRTIAGWAKADSDTMAVWTNVFGFTGPGTNGQHFDIQIVGGTGTTTAGYFGLHRHGWEMDITANDLEWHHLAGTFDGSTVNLYGDGRLVNTGTVNNVNTPGPVHMGKRQDNDNYFEGLVDDVRIYDVALSQAEIAWIAGKRTPMHKAL